MKFHSMVLDYVCMGGIHSPELFLPKLGAANDGLRDKSIRMLFGLHNECEFPRFHLF